MNKRADYEFYCHTADQKSHLSKNASAGISYFRALKAYPNESSPNIRSAKLFGNIQKYKQAEFRYRKACIMKPDCGSLYNEWGLLLDKQGKLEGQEELYRKALEVNPSIGEAMCNLGAVLTEKCQYEEAIKYLERAIDHSPKNHAFMNNLGSINLTIGNYEKAIMYFKESIEHYGEYFLSHMNLALTFMCLSKEYDAEESYEKGKEFMKRAPGKKGWLMREFKKLLKTTKQKLLEEEDGNKEHQRSLCHGLEEIIGLLEKEDFC